MRSGRAGAGWLTARCRVADCQVAGASPVKVQRFVDYPRWRFPEDADPHWVRMSGGSIDLRNVADS